MKQGKAAMWLSNLSKSPPCPGIRFEKSFTPITRFIMLAKAYPITENIDTKNKTKKVKRVEN